MATPITFGKDSTGASTYAPDFADTNFGVTLAASVAQSFTVPSDVPVWTMALSYSPGSSVWVARNNSAAVPGGSFGSTNSALNPGARRVLAGDVIYFITDDTAGAQVSVELYARP